MERPLTTRRNYTLLSLAIALATLIPSAGCLHLLVASGIYLWQGGNIVPAECEELESHRVVVVCRPPASSEYSHAGASRQLSRNVSNLLRENVPKIEMVDPREVDKWLDESDWGDFLELGRAVKADRLVVIDLAHFDLYKGKTLYQGSSEVNLTVYDMNEGGAILWERNLGDMLFPQNSAIPAQDKPVKQFQREYVGILAEQIAVYFYKHDPNADFALDALANR
jgi:hypothetical protein